MNKNRFHNPAYRMLVALLSVSLLIGPGAETAYAAQTALADIPIASKVTAKPNIVYTLDDSGSMQFNYLPDWVIAAQGAAVSISKITRVGTTATATVASTAALATGQYVTIYGPVQPEYAGSFQITVASGTTFTYQVTGAPITPATVAPFSYTVGTGYCRSGNNATACTANNANYGTTFQSPPFYAADFNRLAYNPNVNYTPPVQADGTPLTHTIGTDTDINGNQAFFAHVQTDPFGSKASFVSLVPAVAVPLYCNTDWPVTAGANLALNPDVGDANGEYKAGAGGWCRINGTKYDASAASGAPAVVDDYNYPYQSSNGTTGTQYFYKLLGNKILYCDTSSPYYPRNPNVITGCLVGTPVLGPPPVTKQTCKAVAKTCNTVTPTWSLPVPPPCTATALYCAPNTGGSDGNSIGTGAPPECLACTCVANYQPLPAAKCSSTGLACTTVCGVGGCDPTECPDVTGVAPITGCGAGGVPTYALSSAVCAGGNGTTTSNFLWDPIANAVSATTTLQDSAAQGYACRHNNQLYAVSGAGGNTPFTYPRTNASDVYAANKAGPAPFTQTGAFTQAVTSGCPTIGTTINIPRHYYTIASVQFCDHIDTTVNGQWKGFGTGACQANNDLQQHPVAQYGKFTRIGLVNDGRTYPYTDQVTGAAMSRSYAQEIINYANWFAYYRLRAHAAKTTSTLAFNLLDPTYRVGFHILGTEPTPIGNGLPISWVDVKDFNLAQRTAWWTALFAVPTVTTNKTPTMSAMLRIGNLFETGGTGGLPASVNVSGAFSAAKDPFDKDSNNNLISCANNYHILFTDGFTQQIALPAVAGEKDDTIPAAWPLPGTLPDGSNNPDNVLPDLPVATTWPAPFKWGTKAVPDTLADVSMYYWARDLRPALKDNVPSWSGKAPNDLDPTKDVAWWQHVNFSAISFGAAGTLDASNQAATLAAIGTTEQWPNLTAPNNPPLPPSNKGAVAVDDLWHAAINARGTFVYAKSPLEVQYGLATILASIANQRKSRAGAAFSGTVLSSTNNIIYEATIEPGWSGDVLKVQIDPVDAHELGTLWQAGQQLSNQIRPTSATDEPWMDETKRRIVTWNGATRVGFRETAGSLPPLSATQMATLSPDPVTQKKMVHYLRGGNIVNMPLAPVNGFVIEGTGIGQFRSRYGKAPACPLCAPAKPFAGGASLGDISNAGPLVVSAPIQDVFYETSDPGYFNFSHVTAAGRPDVVVAAANDGMVHVIDSNDGHEIFAYVPSSLLRSAGAPDFAVDSAGKPTGLQALTFQDGGVPIYKHHFYVDSSPRSVNVDFNSAGVKGGASDWHTIVVGGMGKGGRSYYAFDLTDANVTNEADAGGKLLWEFTDATDWRYTYGRPVIVKTYAFGWTVIVTSGYNNISEEGRIYFLDPKKGTELRPHMSVGRSCGVGNPAGLAQINGFTKDYHNQFAEQIYGGDLCGNMWRFNISDPNSGNWTVDKFAVLTEKSTGLPQPVTTAPQIEIDFANGVNRYVFIGTGQLLDAIDLTVPTPAQGQTLWAIRDGSLSTPTPSASLPINARAALTPIAAGGAALPSAPNGWFHDLPTGATAERVVVDVEADANVIIYIGTQVPNDPCLIALPADIYAREFASGKALLYDSANNPYVYDPAGGVGLQIVGLQDPVTGAITLGGFLSHEIPGTKPLTLLNPLFGGKNRLSWRALSGE